MSGTAFQYQQTVKRMIRNTARQAGFSIMKYPVSPFPVMPIFDLSVQYLMAVKGKALQFVQIGANDGVYGDPLRAYVTQFPWRGILVEPQRDVFAKLCANYDAEKERLIFENIAISDHLGDITMYGPRKNGSDTTTYETTVSSADPRIAGKQLKKSKGEMEAFTVPCLTLNALLNKHQISHFDLLQIDVEGHELKILSTLDLSKFIPLIIQFECGHLSPGDVERIVQYLTRNHYRVLYGGIQMDTLAYHESFPLENFA